MLKALNQNIYQTFDYVSQNTQVDSLIDETIINRQGVCQDFTHVIIALARQLGVLCRYVSGYLFHRLEDHNRSAEDANHAWLETFLPGLDWVGFDPTNNLLASERHIKVVVGRDYADVPPARGVFVGNAKENLDVGVRVVMADAPAESDENILPDTPWCPLSLEIERNQRQQQ